MFSNLDSYMFKYESCKLSKNIGYFFLQVIRNIKLLSLWRTMMIGLLPKKNVFQDSSGLIVSSMIVPMLV